MTSVKGIFENGQVRLLEEVSGKTGQKVIVTFLDEESYQEDLEIRNISFSQPNNFWKEYLEDEREDLYQDYAKKNNK